VFFLSCAKVHLAEDKLVVFSKVDVELQKLMMPDLAREHQTLHAEGALARSFGDLAQGGASADDFPTFSGLTGSDGLVALGVTEAKLEFASLFDLVSLVSLQIEFGHDLVDLILLQHVGDDLFRKLVVTGKYQLNQFVGAVVGQFLVDQQQADCQADHEALVIAKQAFSNVGVNVKNAAVELFPLSCLSSDGVDEIFDTIDFLMKSVFVATFSIEENFLFDVVAVDKYAFLFVGLGHKDSYAVF
jgi:hypothetical protein